MRRLAADGWDISFCHHRDERPPSKRRRLRPSLGARVLAVQADLTAAAEVTAWARRAEEDLGPVQAVGAARGSPGISRSALLTDADWRAVTDTSLDGVFHLCRAVLPAMMERQSGRIVAVSSVSGVYGRTTADAARAGIAGFTGRWPARPAATASGPTPSRPPRTSAGPT